jgi:hypothetical protein
VKKPKSVESIIDQLRLIGIPIVCNAEVVISPPKDDIADNGADEDDAATSYQRRAPQSQASRGSLKHQYQGKSSGGTAPSSFKRAKYKHRNGNGDESDGNDDTDNGSCRNAANVNDENQAPFQGNNSCTAATGNVHKKGYTSTISDKMDGSDKPKTKMYLKVGDSHKKCPKGKIIAALLLSILLEGA